MEVTLSSRRGRGHNLQGTAKLCIPQGEIFPLTVDGYLQRAWLDADGKPVTFYFRSLKGAQPRLNFSLFGSWQGQMLLLDDKGNMAMSFAADGRAKGYLNGANSPKEDTTGTRTTRLKVNLLRSAAQKVAIAFRPFEMRSTYFC